MTRLPARPPRSALLPALLLLLSSAAAPAAREKCLRCHDTPSLKAADGRTVAVDGRRLAQGAHAGRDCTECHTQPADYSEVPHFLRYRRVDCSGCHAAQAQGEQESYHGAARARGAIGLPTCSSCHRAGADPHAIKPIDARTAGAACRSCHAKEAEGFAGSVHAAAAAPGAGAAAPGAVKPGCTTCHPAHGRAAPPSAGAINKTCSGCHERAMQDLAGGAATHAQASLGGTMSCASCHDVHATHKPHLDEHTLQACWSCHPKLAGQFKGSVHEGLLGRGLMTCLSCHRSHQVRDAREEEKYGCGACHAEQEEKYRASAHRLARLRGGAKAATCAACHGGHQIVAVSDPASPVNRARIPDTCGHCHGETAVITSDFVRLPISVPRYMQSVHGVGWKAGKATPVCIDCHGTHDLQGSASPASSIHKENLAQTCGRCHVNEAREYASSVHGRALAEGIHDSPSCADCHEDHLIYGVSDARSQVRPEKLAVTTCARCHEKPEMAAKYGLPLDVIQSYRDSYHGWAIQRGGKAVAVCTDCHGHHAIGSVLDPKASINKANVVATCGKCHPKASPEFAASYTHVLARGRRMAHDWVRLVYLWLIGVVLGGMLLHNLLVWAHELRQHRRKLRSEPAVRRLTRSEVVQHAILLVTFFGLALTGFALRFPGSWWAQALGATGLAEDVRRNLHRLLAVALVLASIFHVLQLALTRRGRMLLRAMLPRASDLREALGSVLYYLGRRAKRPAFGFFDYTQKAEYWALVWGTAVMGLTGFVLWFPTRATALLPAWIVRVCETIHFFEAILAVSAIFIWHFYFVIFRKSVYPMSLTFLDGRMPLEEWHDDHGRADAELGTKAEVLKPQEPPPA